MPYYLIENLMGIERPIAEGGWEKLQEEKEIYENQPAAKKVCSGKNEFFLKAIYYLVSKDAWDAQHCPLIPVDLS